MEMRIEGEGSMHLNNSRFFSSEVLIGDVWPLEIEGGPADLQYFVLAGRPSVTVCIQSDSIYTIYVIGPFCIHSIKMLTTLLKKNLNNIVGIDDIRDQ